MSPSWGRVRHALRPGSLGGRLATGTAWSLGAALAGQGGVLLAGVVAARLLGAEAYGKLTLVSVTMGMLGAFAGLGLGLTATKFVAELRGRDPGRIARILSLADRTVLLAGVIATTAMIVGAPVIADRVLGQPEMVDLLRLGAVLLLLNEVVGVQTGTLAGFEAFRDVARIAAVRGVVGVPLAAAGVLALGAAGGILALEVGALLAVVLGRHALRRVKATEGIPRAEGSLLAEGPVLWRFTLPAFVATAVVGPVWWMGSVLLSNQPDGLTQVGIFNAANQWRTAVLFLPNVIGQAIMPVMASLYAGRRARELRTVVWSATGAASAIALAAASVLLVGRNLIMGLYGPEFAEAGDVLAVIALSVLVVTMFQPSLQLLAASGRMWANAASNLVWAGAFLVAALRLVPGGGALGLAGAYLVAFGAQAVLVLALGWRVLATIRPGSSRAAQDRPGAD